MKYNELVACWGSLTSASKALGIKNIQTVHAWKDRKRIPTRWQLKATALSGGRLKPDRQARRDAAELAAYVKGAGDAQ
jgi:hypothetical protein